MYYILNHINLPKNINYKWLFCRPQNLNSIAGEEDGGLGGTVDLVRENGVLHLKLEKIVKKLIAKKKQKRLSLPPPLKTE